MKLSENPHRSDPFRLAEKSLAGEALSREEALAVLDWPEDELPGLLAAAYKVRKAHFGRKVRLNFLANIQSGVCPEDCSYCSQSKVSKAPIDKYKLMSAEKIVQAAEGAVERKAARLCLVAAGRGPSDGDVDHVAEAVRRVKAKYPHLEICACLGLLADGQAEKLKGSGVHAYNHNLNTSEARYASICSTHTHADRVETVEKAKSGGLSACSGAIFGMGETREDVLDVAYRLREMKVDSIPLNFLIPIQGTPLAGRPVGPESSEGRDGPGLKYWADGRGREEITPPQCLKILCLFRLLCPASELRIAGGRELHLRSLQPLGLLVANSIFIGDYLTTEGQAASADVQMIRDLGFEIAGENAPAPSERIADKVVLLSQKSKN
jgi:biotin synthase